MFYIILCDISKVERRMKALNRVTLIHIYVAPYTANVAYKPLTNYIIRYDDINILTVSISATGINIILMIKIV